MRSTIHAPASRQDGATLIVGLIMLVLMTLLALAAINMSTGNLKIVGNMQYQKEATSAAQSAVNQVWSKGSYLIDPTTAPTSMNVTVNGASYPVTLTAPCIKSSVTIAASDLDVTKADDRACITSAAKTNSGIMGQHTSSAPSDCAKVTWQVTASVDDSYTNTKVQLIEGASLRMDRILADAYRNDATKRCAI
ncbi:MAG TPA: pilus assembly PilX N-terminal domain-containing protein [Paucimonas sp.]|nr:pilus assembly PilX N-terminal domain-containing protein [Paucimonas sp.]